MAEGDIFYSKAKGWLIEGSGGFLGLGGTEDIPLSQSPDPFLKALWAILRQLPILDGTSDKNIQAIFEAAWNGAEGATGKPAFWDRLSPQVAWGDLDATFVDAEGNPDPIKKQNYIQEVYATAKLLGLIPKDVEPPRAGAKEKIVAGEGYGGPPGSLFIRDENGNLTPYTPPEGAGQPAAIVRGEDVGFVPGTWFIRQPTGWLTPYTPPSQASEPSFNQQFDRLLGEKRYDEAAQLWDIREQITSQGGRMTRAQAAQFLTGDLFKAEEIPALLDALMGPQSPSTSSRQAPAAAETPRLPGPEGQPGNINVGGFLGPTVPPRVLVPGAGGPGGEQANPRIPIGAGGPGTPGRGIFDPQAALNAFLQAAQKQTQPPNVFQAALQSPPPNYQAMTPSDLDPLYNTASPEAQAAIEAELARLQSQTAGGDQTSTTAEGQAIRQVQAEIPNEFNTSTPEGADLWARMQASAAQRRGVGPTGKPFTFADLAGGSSATPGPAGQTPTNPISDFEKAYQAQGGAGRTGVFMVPAGMNPWDAAVALSKTPQGLATSAAINAVTPEARAQMAEEVRLQRPQGPKPMTFADAVAVRNERVRQQQMLRKQGRTIFA